MKTKTMKKILALIICITMVLTCTFTGVVVSANKETAEGIVASTRFADKPILSEYFTESRSVPTNWVADYAFPFLYNNSGYVNKLQVVNWDTNGWGLDFGTVKQAHIIAFPNLGTENYVLTVEAAFAEENFTNSEYSDGAFGIATNINADHTKATYASIIEVNPELSKFKTFTRTQVSTWSEDKQKTEPTFADIGCFENNTVVALQKFTLKAYHINDVTYFYCNGVYVGEVDDWDSEYSDRIGIYSIDARSRVYSVTVNGLAEDLTKEVDTARINNHPVYTENFSSYGNGSVTPTGWVKHEYSFLYNHANAINYLSCASWKDDDNVRYLTYKAKGGGHIMTLPAMGNENYVYTVRAKMSEYSKDSGMGNVGIVTDIRNDYENTSAVSIFEVNPENNKFNMFSRVDNGSSGVDKNLSGVSFTDDSYFTNDTLSLNDEIILTAYHINDVSYFYCNGVYVGKLNDYANDGVSDRVGLYSYGGNLSVYEVTVKEILPTTTDIEEKVVVSNTLVSEDLTKYTVADSLPTDWKKVESSWAYKSNVGEIDFYYSGSGLRVAGYGGTGAVMLPSLGTANYVFTAVINVRDTSSFGLITNMDDPDPVNGATLSILYTQKDGSDLIYQYNRSGSSVNSSEQELVQTNVIGKQAANGDEYTLKAYSYNGVTYFFVNDIFVSSIEQRDPQAASRCGIYSYGGAIVVKSVNVSAISGVVETDAITMSGAEISYSDLDGETEDAAAGFRFVADVDTTKEVCAANYANATFGMVVSIADNLAYGGKITAGTPGVVDIKAAKPAENTANAAIIAEINNLTVAARNKNYVARAYMAVDNNGTVTYYYSNQISRSPVGIANLFYSDTTITVTDDIKGRLDKLYGSCKDYLGANDGSIKFSAFSDFHYIDGQYAGTVDKLNQIVNKAYNNNVDFILQCGDFCNDYKGSPEITKAYINNNMKLKAYGVYGNHELENSGNSMELVTPLLTNDSKVVWGTDDTNIGDGSIGYYYFDQDGFRMIFLDTNYSWNPTASVWEHNTTASYGPPSGNTKTNSLGPVQLAWFEEILIDAANNGLHCIVSSHESFSGTIVDVSPDGEAVRALYRKVNNIRPKTVVLSMNGHQHTNTIDVIDDVVYFNINTANNGFWEKHTEEHYTAGQTFKKESYDAEGNLIGITDAELTSLSSSASTWFFANPLSAIVTVTKSGIVKIDGMETDWMYGVAPTTDYANELAENDGMGPRIDSGTFGGQKETKVLTIEQQLATLDYTVPYTIGDRKMVWYDEFDDKSINSNYWGYRSLENPVDYDVNAGWDNIREHQGELQMYATYNSETGRYTTSPSISTKGKMSFKYGYLEMRAKVPFVKGAFPSLWAMTDDRWHDSKIGAMCEIDIFEVFANETTLIPNIHKWVSGSDDKGSFNENLPNGETKRSYTFDNASDNLEHHVFGFEWTEDEIRLYIDHVDEDTKIPDLSNPYATFDLNKDFLTNVHSGMDCFREYIYLIIDNALFTNLSEWKPNSNYLTNETKNLPQYKIDYIRLYQNPNTDSIIKIEG